MKHVIGIDPSLTNAAICFLYEDGTRKMQTYQADEPYGTTVVDRIVRLYDHAAKIATTTRWDRKNTLLLLLEGYSFGSKGNNFLTLAEFGALLRQQLRLCGTLELTREVAPSTLKQFVLGKGVGKKNQIGAHLAHRYHVLLNDDDEYDAFGLAKLAACVVGWDEPANEGQRKAVAKIRAMDKAI